MMNINNCPRCNSSDVEWVKESLYYRDSYHLICNGCCLTSISDSAKTFIVMIWNSLSDKEEKKKKNKKEKK